MNILNVEPKNQAVSCPCGKIFAACADPYCYTDKEWQDDVRKYLAKGCKVREVPNPVAFEKCTCTDFTPPNDSNQLTIFDQQNTCTSSK